MVQAKITKAVEVGEVRPPEKFSLRIESDGTTSGTQIYINGIAQGHLSYVKFEADVKDHLVDFSVTRVDTSLE